MTRSNGTPRARCRTRAVGLVLVLASVCALLGGEHWAGAHAQTAGTGAVAVVTRIEGTCERLPARCSEWVPAAVGCLVHPGDRVRCGAGSWASLGLVGGGFVTLGPDCEVRFDSLLYLRLLIGRLWAKVKPVVMPGGAGLIIETPSAVVGVRGTHFSVWVHDQLCTTVSVASGAVSVFGSGVAVTVPEGYATRVKRGRVPEKPEPMDSEEKRAWAEKRERFKDEDEGDDDDESFGNDGGGAGGKADKQGQHRGNAPSSAGSHPGGKP